MSHTHGNAATVLAHVASQLGSCLVAYRAVSGGDINEAYRAELSNGQEVFVKLNSRAPVGLFEVEAQGLGWLARCGAVRVPEVLAVGESPAFLCLELIVAAPRASDFDDALGRQLADMHRCTADSFGLEHDNFIGRLRQDNRPCNDWVSFYRDRRLAPQIRQAVDSGQCAGNLAQRLDALLSRIEQLAGPSEPPSRLHGDLWAGNLHCDRDGQPVLIDPAVYAGHREVDLAMMQLFGGFSPRVFAAYAEQFPLSPGAAGRVPLYQLYPLLVHVNHFGAGYVGQLDIALRQLE